jgi:hypothetical protein
MFLPGMCPHGPLSHLEFAQTQNLHNLEPARTRSLYNLEHPKSGQLTVFAQPRPASSKSGGTSPI